MKNKIENQFALVNSCAMKFALSFLILFVCLAADATMVSFTFTNAGTGRLDTNDFKIIPVLTDEQNNAVRNSDGSFQISGLPIRVSNPTGHVTNYLAAYCYQVTNQFIGKGFYLRIPDSSSNVLESGDSSIFISGANMFVTLTTPSTNSSSGWPTNWPSSSITNAPWLTSVPPTYALLTDATNAAQLAAKQATNGITPFSPSGTISNAQYAVVSGSASNLLGTISAGQVTGLPVSQIQFTNAPLYASYTNSSGLVVIGTNATSGGATNIFFDQVGYPFSGSQLPTNFVVIDATNGVDATAARGFLNPWKTLANAITNTAPNTTFVFQPGSYTLPNSIYNLATNVAFIGQGSALIYFTNFISGFAPSNGFVCQNINFSNVIFYDTSFPTNLTFRNVNFYDYNTEDVFRNGNRGFFSVYIDTMYVETVFDVFLQFYNSSLKNVTVVDDSTSTGRQIVLGGIFRGDNSTLVNCKFTSISNYNPIIQCANVNGIDWDSSDPNFSANGSYYMGTNAGKLYVSGCSFFHTFDTNTTASFGSFTLNGSPFVFTNSIDGDIFGMTNTAGYWIKNGASKFSGIAPTVSATLPQIITAQLPSNVALKNTSNTWNQVNTFTGPVNLTNAANTISGTFTGNGSGITNLASCIQTGTTNATALSAFVATFSKNFADTNYTALAIGNGFALASSYVSSKTISNCVFNMTVATGKIDWTAIHK